MTAPPRTAELVLESLGASAQFRDPLLGDLAEGFASRVELDGLSRARRWYYREALRTAPHMLREGLGQLRARDVKRIAGVGFAAYCLVLMLGFLVSMMTGAILAAWDIAPLRFGRPGDPLFYVAYALGFAAAVIGGVIAAWLDERTPLLSALALGGTWAALAIITSTALASGAEMGWMRVIAPLMIVAGTTLGGVLRIRALNTLERANAMPLSSGR
jgi:hypothetical protein